MQPSPYSQTGERLIDMGYSAIPIMPGSKRPGNMSDRKWYGDMDWNRFCDRLPTHYETGVWNKWPDAGVCVVLDHNIKVIDVDTDDPEIRAAVMEVIPPPTVIKRGQKGFSAFYRGSPAIVNRPINLRLPGGFESRIVDLLAYGRQTVLPPTIHPDTGKPYEWEYGGATLMEVAPEDLPELPDDIADRLVAAIERFGEVPEFKPRAPSGEHVLGDSIWRDVNTLALNNLDAWVPALDPHAKRHRDGSYRMVATWRGVENANVGIHPTGIMDWGASQSYTPIDLVMASNNTTYFESAYKWLADRLGFAPQEDEWMERARISAQRMAERSRQKMAEATIVSASVPVPVNDNPVPAIRAPRSHMDPFAPGATGGLLEAIAKWALDTSRRPSPEMAMLTAIGFVSALFSRRAVGPTDSGLNLYIVGVAGTGFGKEHVLKTLQTLAVDSGFSWLIGPSDVTSGSAIEKIVRRRPAFIMPWDEMGVLLQSVNGRSATTWAKTIRKVLLELFSKSTSMWTGKEHADPTKDSSAEPIYAPTVSVLGMSTPETFYGSLTEETLSDGFLNRILIVSPSARPPRKRETRLITPASLIEMVKDYAKALPQSDMAAANSRNGSIRPSMFVVPWGDDKALARWEAIEDWQVSQVEDHGKAAGVYNRAAEQSVKLATIRALSRNPAEPRVWEEDVEWGYAIVQRSLDYIEQGIEQHMAGSQFEELVNAIMVRLRNVPGGSIKMGELVRAKGVSKADERMVKMALNRLVERGDIYQPAVNGKGVRVTLVGHEQEAD